MARADLLKKLFLSYQRREDREFRDAAEAIVQEERKKHHVVLANELERILRNGTAPSSVRPAPQAFHPPPQDSDRGAPLFDIRYPDRYLAELVLTPDVRLAVERIKREFREWDVLEANGLPPTQKVLFCGPSGCGKTATASSVASELGLPLMYVRFDAVVSSLLGETATNLRKVFDYASRGHWVVLFDEFDAIGRSRDDATEHGEIKRVVNTFLQIMDSFRGRSLIIAATNFEQALDPAIWRRFDEIVRFEKPQEHEIQSLLKKRLAILRHTDDDLRILVEQLSSVTFADVERLAFDVRKAAAVRGSTRLSREDVQEAVSRYCYRQSVLHKVEKLGNPSVDKE
ncbi:MAG TPA: ATP-binding protein [Longimicrobium sp.]|nr:ATP-binding protein [Longimicrobium sp.]